jgi:hypothetical protein
MNKIFGNDNLRFILIYIVMAIFLVGGYYVKFGSLESQAAINKANIELLQNQADLGIVDMASVKADLIWIKLTLSRIEDKIDSKQESQ